MAEIVPFKGIRYDTSRVDASSVLAPPYDVIDGDQRARLAALDKHNCVNVILPEGEGDDKYPAANAALNSWLEEGILIRDDVPCIYRYHQTYQLEELGPEPVTRKGFIAAVRLHPFDARVIRRHERTHKGPKIDRLKLWDCTSSHLSQIFTLYSDPTGETDRAFSAAEAQEPVLDGTTADGTRHRVWRVSDAETIEVIQKHLADTNLYIADGHHRYETMLALQEKMRDRAGGGLDEHSAAQYGMLFLANMDDPGLVVLPTHRLVHSVADFAADEFCERIAKHFSVIEVPGAAQNGDVVRRALDEAAKVRPSFAAVLPGRPGALILTLREDVDLRAEGLEGSEAGLGLDVTLLHGLILEKVLGIDRAAQEAKTNIAYVKDTQEALDRTAGGEGQVCFIMNPTPVKQVVAVSDADDVMPQKSTFFYPKIASGTVFNRVDPTESLA